jgi:hypothetical protein
MPESESTPEDVARWMLEEFNRHNGELYQEDAAAGIEARFGRSFTYENADGGVSISRAVLRHFRKLTEGTVVWERGDKLWRRKESGDGEGRLAE